MCDRSFFSNCPATRLSAKIFTALGLAIAVVWCGPETAAQKEAPAKKPRVEEEETNAPRPKVPYRGDDDEPKGSASSVPVDLQKEAVNPKLPDIVRQLYLRMAIPHDEITRAGSAQPIYYVPIPRFLGTTPNFEEKLKAQRISKDGKPGEWDSYESGNDLRVVPYERLAMEQAKDFQAKVAKTMPDTEALLHAERVLAEAARFHETASERGQRLGSEWDRTRDDLRNTLRKVRLDRLRALAKAGEWASAFELDNLLTDTYPQNSEVRAAVISVRIQHAERLLEGESSDAYVQARRTIDHLERRFPNIQDQQLKTLRERLVKYAGRLVEKIQELKAKNQTEAAKTQLSLVESIWPQLPAIRSLRQDLKLDEILYVAVDQLPLRMSPATATSNSERYAVELLFESLVRPVADPASGQKYESVLAAGSPEMIVRGRQFQLVGDARWYQERSGETPLVEPVLNADVQATFTRNREYIPSPQWRDLLQEVSAEGDPFSVRIKLSQGYLDPLSLMRFKVLPTKYVERPGDMQFALAPIGSGPYMYVGRKTEGSVEYAVFQANPTYSSRAHKKGQPHIREIRFFSAPRAWLSFKENPAKLHLMLDINRETIREMESPEVGLRDVKIYSLPNRRVWFLAANHRRSALKNVDLRRAIAMSINREKILNDIFRDGSTERRDKYRSLNGPYPAGSWPCDPNLPAELFDPSRASSLAAKGKWKGKTLELAYPSDVPGVADACKAIQAQILEAAGIELKLKAYPLRELRDVVETKNDYDLAYYFWDHMDNSFWLGPLFDPNSAGTGGSNFLGQIENGGTLQQLFQKATQVRAFEQVRQRTHAIHVELDALMPLIPLWQLPTNVAIHERLQVTPKPEQWDALSIFTHAEQWMWNPK